MRARRARRTRVLPLLAMAGALAITGHAAAQDGAAASAPAMTAEDPSHGAAMRAYHTALAQRRLGSQEALSLDLVKERVAAAEEQSKTGRTDEAIARMLDLVENPRFDAFANDEAGRAAVYVLGDALATSGAYAPARAYLRRLLAQKGAWDDRGTYARRAVRRLVEIAIESDRLDDGVADVKAVPPSAPEETRGEIAYLTARAKEATGDADGAIQAYASVPQRSRFWAQATYLAGLLHVEHGRYKEGEGQFCKIADPKSTGTAAVYADERFFAVRDLARLALGRVAHEQFRFDDARYYYYLVPRDSDRLAEALYEAATSRYEKKDYDGARELLDELKGLGIHHRYEDEVWILDAYLDLAQCKFPESDKKLVTFLQRYEPIRDAVRKIQGDDRSMQQLLAAARAGSDAAAVEGGASSVPPETLRTIAALVRLDPGYAKVLRRRAVLEHEAAGMELARHQLEALQKSLASNGAAVAAVDDSEPASRRAADVRDALEGAKRQIDDLEASGAAAATVAPLRAQYNDLAGRAAPAVRAAVAPTIVASTPAGHDLPDLLRSDAAAAASYGPEVDDWRRELIGLEARLAREALRRVDLRLSRLLRRARLGRIESVLGRKRALEVEIEALSNGVLPASALDSLEAARYLKDDEEYWPYEGDDWPDEYVGGESLK